jgi:hypothetical protein
VPNFKNLTTERGHALDNANVETNAVEPAKWESKDVIKGAARAAEAATPPPQATSKRLSAENFSVHRSPASTEL